jgi:hydroxypyruvate isomerase
MIQEAASEYVWGVKSPGRVANKYKISVLKKLIKEELEVILTNEEAGELFGEEVEAQLNEMEAERVDEAETRSDVARVGKKLGQVSGMEGILASIDNRAEFEQLLMQFIQMVAKEKLRPEDVKVGVRRVAAQILKGK